MLRNWSLNPLAKVAIGILRSYGADAHIYLPGVGTLNGITAGNYLDSAGTTAASVDNPVGLSLDALQAMTLGSELVTNGDFAAGTTGFASAGIAASTMSVVAGEAQLIPTVGYGRQIQAIACVSGQTYQIGCKARVISGGGRAFIGITTSSVGVAATTIGNTSSSTQVSLSGLFVASATTMYLVFGDDLNVAGGTLGFDDISIKQVPGIHATQATTANKPILRRGLLNQLLQSTSFTSPWATTGASIVPSATTYNNGDAAVLFQETAGGTFHELYQPSLSFTAGSPVTLAFIAKKSTSTAFQLFLTNSVKSNAYANFNLNAGSLGAVGAGATSSIADLGGGWYLTVLNVTPTSTISHYAYTGLINGDVNSAIDPSYSGTLGNGVYLYRAGLFQGTYTAQQIIDAGGIPLTTSAAASSTTGKYSWQFDGSNDSLLTGNLGITNTVSVVIAGVLNSLPTTTDFADEGVNGLQILIRNTGVIDCFKAGVEPIISAASGTIVAGVPFVLTFRLQGGVSVLRKNGAQVSTAAYVASLSATAGLSIGEAPVSINGSIYSIDVITATTTDSDLLTLERLAGQLSGVSI